MKLKHAACRSFDPRGAQICAHTLYNKVYLYAGDGGAITQKGKRWTAAAARLKICKRVSLSG